MGTNITMYTEQNVSEFIEKLDDPGKRTDTTALISLISRHTGLHAKMWGTSIIGFGTYHYKYASGHEGDAPLVGFSPRKTSFSVYLAPIFDDKISVLEQLGKYKTGAGCIYFRKLSDIHPEILLSMIEKSVEYLQKNFPAD